MERIYALAGAMSSLFGEKVPIRFGEDNPFGVSGGKSTPNSGVSVELDIECSTVSRDTYGLSFRRARLDAARTLNPAFEDRAGAAQEMGVTNEYLRRLESGEKRPGFEMLETMAKTYNVLVGDLFPSSAPKGTEMDRVLASLMSLPPTPRTILMTQFEGMARALAASIADVQTRAEALRVVGEHGINEERSNVSQRTQIEDDAPPMHGLELGKDESPSRNGEYRAQRNRPRPTGKPNP
jgi:transcriptional regulator with XRE-family HTH domain